LTSLHVCRGNPGATTVQHAARTMHVQFSTHTHTHAHTGEHRHTRRESKVGGIVNTLGWRAAFFNEVGTEVGRALPVPDGDSQADEFAPDLQQQSPAPPPPLAHGAGSRSLEMPAAPSRTGTRGALRTVHARSPATLGAPNPPCIGPNRISRACPAPRRPSARDSESPAQRSCPPGEKQ
jgi:hypothetical protein